MSTASFTVPFNATTRKFYQGRNMAKLMEACEDNGWKSGAFATYVQWRRVGRVVTSGKGSGTKCMYVRNTNEGQEGAPDDRQTFEDKCAHDRGAGMRPGRSAARPTFRSPRT